MKRLKYAIAILIIIPLCIIASHIYLKYSVNDMIEMIAKAQTCAQQGQKKEAAKQIAAFQSAWKKDRAVMSTFIRHDELDTVNLSSAKLGPFLNGNSEEEFFAESESLRMQLEHIRESDQFSLDNVL